MRRNASRSRLGATLVFAGVLAISLSSVVPISCANPDAIVATINVGYTPSGVAVNHNTDRVYVTNKLSDTTSVIGGSTEQVVATINGLSLPFLPRTWTRASG